MIGCRRWPRNSLAGQWLSPLRPAASPPRWRPRPQPRPFRFVFSIGGDPIKQGLAASFNRPGGNSTGITLLTNQLEPKRLGLLRQLVPQATTIGFLLNPNPRPRGRGHMSPARGLLRLHSRYGPPDRSAAQGDLCHEAPTRAVTRTSRSSATGSIDNSPCGIFLH